MNPQEPPISFRMLIPYCSTFVGNNGPVLFYNPLEKDSHYKIVLLFYNSGNSALLNYFQHDLLLLSIVSEINGLLHP